MRIEYDRDTCIGMFQCTAEWDAFERDEDAGKAVLAEAEEREDGVFVTFECVPLGDALEHPDAGVPVVLDAHGPTLGGRRHIPDALAGASPSPRRETTV